MHYPRFEALGIEPDYLWIGANAIHNLLAHTPPLAGARSQAERPHVRAYASQYVGVAKVRDRWVGLWGARGACQGPRRELSPEGERQAAWDRARALGRDWIEVRDAS